MPKEQKEDKNIKEEEKNDLVIKLYEIGQTIATLRGKPLLLLFYSKERAGGIETEDIFHLENVLEQKLKDYHGDLDVVIQTIGGSADTAYLLSQLIRDYCNNMEIFIPNYAYSGGTLICLASNKIHLGKTARMSPIDLQLGDEETESQFPLLSIDKYVEFIEESCRTFLIEKEENKVAYIVPLMEKLIEQIKPTDLGALYRVKDLTRYYAQILLMTYMLKNLPEKKRIAQYIINRLTTSTPDHEFEIDFHIAEGIGLNVEQMEEKIYKYSRLLISVCSILKRNGEICKFYSDDANRRKPFFEVFLPKKVEEVKKNESSTHDEK